MPKPLITDKPFRHRPARDEPTKDLTPRNTEQSLDVPPAHIGRDRPGMDQFKGALVFAFHDPMVSKNDTIPK